ncbi:MAG: type II toxin-antitoxin system HigB family toxin [Prolixibacteraceae bacterium]|nr:type II toxin-antitoxin system HigB family toxin [Prolixibacteraceae bacterium]
MRIVTFRRIQEYSEQHPQSRTALEDWYHKTTKAEWNDLNDMRRTFNSVDYIGNSRFVFNIKGNDFRLVAIVIFASKKVYIRFIGTHSEYNQIDCSMV